MGRQVRNTILVDWAVIEALSVERNLGLTYYIDQGVYHIFASEGPVVYETNIAIEDPVVASSDQEHFELFHKPGIDAQNYPLGNKISGADGLYAVDVNRSVSTNYMQVFDTIAMSRASGLHEGETYDKIIATEVTEDKKLMQYELADVCQFQIVMSKVGEAFTINKRACEFFLLQENGDFLLQENGDKLKIVGLIPV